MKKFQCPSCAAEICFQSNVSVYAVCKYCASMVVRRDVDVQAIGTMAALPEDMSPFQIGTQGLYRGQMFGVVGRMKMGWSDGMWNEWFIISDNGLKGWLAEAQGTYAVCFELEEELEEETKARLEKMIHPEKREYDKRNMEDILKIQGVSNVKLELEDDDLEYDPLVGKNIGASLSLKKRPFRIVDIKKVTCIGSEGELPFSAPKGRKALTLDLSGEGSAFASIEIYQGQYRIYIGDYVEWKDLRCSHFRRPEGW